MFNTLGKTLVMINLAASVLAMTAAAGIFLQQIDWGWKEPRKHLEKRIPSEIDKRAAALEEASKALALVLPELKPAQGSYHAAEKAFGPNHLWYVEQLRSIRSATKPITGKLIKMKDDAKDGRPELDIREIGKPVLAQEDPKIKKSDEAYKADLRSLRKEIANVDIQIRDLVAKEKALTEKLIGFKDDKGKTVRPGLYELQEIERNRLNQVNFEIDYIKPRRLDTLNEAETFRERRLDLERTLEAIRGTQGKKQ